MRSKILFTVLAAGLFFAASAEAAILSLVPETRSLRIGQEFFVDLRVNTDSVSINAAQATVHFKNSVLELLSVDKTNSVFNFWVEEPTISNENGTVSLIGGTPSGVSGAALQIIRLKFKAIGSGTSDLTASDAVVTANDGKGTNVLSDIENTSVTVGTGTAAPPPPPPPPSPSPSPSVAAPVEQPVRIERAPVAAQNLPKAPELRVSLYPDESRWYNRIGELIVLWEVPDDIINVATALDNNPRTEPRIAENALFNGKNFGPLAGEGIWYVHVQFRNNRGWGVVAHYKISLDATPPLAFEAEMDALISDNPAPTVRFETFDALSGILETWVFIDGGEPIKTKEKSLVLPHQRPGQHQLLIRVLDNAGNSVEDTLDFEVIPVASPTIDFITKTVSQGEVIFASGKTMPNYFIDVIISDGQEVFRGEANSDNAGNWKVSIGETLATGKYKFSATARDSRGAVSYPTEEDFRIKPKTIISLGIIDLGLFEILILVISLVAAAGGVGTWYYVSAKRTRGAYNIIAARDVEKIATLLESDLKELERLYKSQKDIASDVRPQMDNRFSKLKDTISKMRKYLVKELEKLK